MFFGWRIKTHYYVVGVWLAAERFELICKRTTEHPVGGWGGEVAPARPNREVVSFRSSVRAGGSATDQLGVPSYPETLGPHRPAPLSLFPFRRGGCSLFLFRSCFWVLVSSTAF